MRNYKLKILIVDDNVTLRMCFSDFFLGAGRGVRAAPEGLSASSEIRLREPDILLSD